MRLIGTDGLSASAKTATSSNSCFNIFKFIAFKLFQIFSENEKMWKHNFTKLRKIRFSSFSPATLKIIAFYQCTGCSKSLGHILTLNMSKTIKEITMHLIYSESLQSQVFYRMFKDVQCEHR